MAEYKQGDRVVKMSGVCAGKYGTVNSVREDGTLNVTFDGERLSRFCDPERCGQVATNAIKIGAYGLPDVHPGQKVRVVAPGFRDTGKVLTVERVGDGFGGRIVAGGFAYKPQDLEVANSRAANAKPTGRFGKYAEELVQLYNRLNGGNSAAEQKREERINTILRMLSSFGMQAWLMPDGTVGISDTKPSGAKPFRSLLANSRARNANGWPNARMKFKAGDKVRHKTNGLAGVVEGWASDPGQYRVRASGRVYEWDEDDLVLANAARNAVARNAVSIMKDTRKINQWINGTVGDFLFEAKVFDEGSVFGIDKGRVSKLWMGRRNQGGDEVIYERGWDQRPKSPEAKAAYVELMAKLNTLPKVD